MTTSTAWSISWSMLMLIWSESIELDTFACSISWDISWSLQVLEGISLNLHSSSLCLLKSWCDSTSLHPSLVHRCSIVSINSFAVRFKFFPMGPLHVGQLDNWPLTFFITCWQGRHTRWPIGQEAIGPFSGIAKHTGHFTRDLRSSISLSYLSTLVAMSDISVVSNWQHVIAVRRLFAQWSVALKLSHQVNSGQGGWVRSKMGFSWPRNILPYYTQNSNLQPTPHFYFATPISWRIQSTEYK